MQGRGFVVAEDECLANTRKGKQVLNVTPPDEARAIAPAEGELVAAIGENRKMVVFPLDQVPEIKKTCPLLRGKTNARWRERAWMK